MPQLDKYEATHLRNIRTLEKRMRQLYEDALTTIAFRASLYPFASEQFSLSKYPLLKAQIEEIITKLHGELYGNIVAGIDASWSLSAQKNDAFVDRRLVGLQPSQQARAVLYDPNISALNRFKARRRNGLNLSDRVWKTMKPFRKEIEQGLGLMIGEGQPAAEMATTLKKFLFEPDRLFRRVRSEEGVLKLSKAAREYNPGQGVYRSSFKNSLRLTRTETNIAYRSADYERWQKIPFIVGIQIRLSNAHKIYDICDDLQGRYPKDFKFVGWHPQCICNAVPIQMTDEEFFRYQDEILEAGVISSGSVNMVDLPPAGFDDYVQENGERIKGWKNEPYWVKDNKDYVKLK
jgi:hypothetical protein